MKRKLLKPGYEFIFTLSLLAVLGLPPLLFAQDTKDVQINITNGDTTVNGKNIKELSPKERHDALKDIHHLTIITTDTKINGQARIMADNDMGPMGKTNNMRFKFKNGAGKDSTFAFNYRLNDERADKRNMDMNDRRYRNRDENPMMEMSHKNTQSFNYVNTDSEGISTRISYRVSEPSGAVHHMDPNDEISQLEVLELRDLILMPQFEAGKTVLSFTLPTKATAEVQFKDSQGTVLWTDKVMNGQFTKAFSLGLNGVYYLHVKQGGKLAVKKIFKE